MEDLTRARSLLDEGQYTCVVCSGSTVHTATQRGVAPLLNWVNQGLDLTGFSAADRVVGRATAFLYAILGVQSVYARVMSRPAAAVLESHGIGVHADKFVDGIINRAGTGPCPFEAAVMDIGEKEQALTAIRAKMASMQK